MVLVFLWGLLILPQPDPDWPIDDVDDQFLDLEPEVIDLDSNNKAINGRKNTIIVYDNSDKRFVALDDMN